MDERELRWKARRGMKELDVMLARWLDTRWAAAGADERGAFAALLERQDPQLWDLLTGREPPPTELAAVVARIRADAGL